MKITNEDNMKLMARYEDNYFDLAIVDPPYGIGMDKNRNNQEGKYRFKKYHNTNWDNQAPNKEYFKELFRISKNQEAKLQEQFFYRLKNILDENQIGYEDKIIVKLIQRYYPDWRRLINESQRHSASGKIETDVLVDIADINLDHLIASLKNKEFTTVRKWVIENIDNDPNIVMRKIYTILYENIKPKYIPEAVLILAKYQYQIAFVADQEVNLLACLTEIMMGCEFR